MNAHNDNTPVTGAGKVSFHQFNRWAALAMDGQPIGYMTNIGGVTTLHLKQHAPAWLKYVREQGPWQTNSECQEAIKQAAAQVMM